MSRYEWERGEFTIPAAAWPAFKKRLIDAHNAEVEKRFTLAADLHGLVLLAGNG